MTTLIFDWSDWDGPATGHVVVTRRTWRRAPESLHVPWQVVLPVDGRATLDVAHVAGDVVSIRWAPRGAASREDHVLIPDGGEHLAHLLETVDPSTLEPLPEDLPSAVDLVARAEALVTRIESGEFTGADGDDGRGIASVTAEGETATVTYTDGTTSTLTLPRGPAGEPGRDGVDGAPGVDGRDGRDGQDGRTPALSWQGTALAVDGAPGPDLRGPAGKDGADGAPGPAPSIKIGTVTSGATPSATIKGTSPDLTLDLVFAKGDRGEQGIQGPPGVVSSASSYVLVGPGRPDTPSTTGGVIPSPDTTPVGAEFRSQDGANVGAYVWMKRPGGKWEVTVGDTGWRHVAAPTITSGGVRLRRVGSVVTVAFGGGQYNTITTGTLGYAGEITTLPSGFQLVGTQVFSLATKDGASVIGHMQITDTTDGNRIRLRASTGAATGMDGVTLLRPAPAQYVCDQTWPTAPLPGTPA